MTESVLVVLWFLNSGPPSMKKGGICLFVEDSVFMLLIRQDVPLKHLKIDNVRGNRRYSLRITISLVTSRLEESNEDINVGVMIKFTFRSPSFFRLLELVF